MTAFTLVRAFVALLAVVGCCNILILIRIDDIRAAL
eukprot:COSAG05_NODE_12690_length_458_cov_1.231198_1_plen_35_part_01